MGVVTMCSTCREPYRGTGRLFCSRSCRAAVAPQNEPDVDGARQCKRCGVPFMFTQPHSKFCSRHCYRRWHKTYGDGERRRRAESKRVTPTMRLAVMTRDAWTCRICMRPLDLNQRAPQSFSPSIDHVLPLAAGGRTVLDNLQAAHFECNWRKSDELHPWGGGGGPKSLATGRYRSSVQLTAPKAPGVCT